MKFQTVLTAIAALATPLSVLAKSQDYARHIELSLLFYEAQRSGPLPENNRVYWRHDSMLDAGEDNNVDLTGGYYDAGDNVKFNFPQAGALSLLAWSAVDWKDGYKKAGQWEYMKDLLRWGMDYFIKCHTGKNELYGQVGNGSNDHGAWLPPEEINYEYPSYKIDASHPGSDLAAETAAAMVAASMAFRDDDPSYADTLLKHGKEIYDFADKYRGTYDKSITDAKGYYRSYSGYYDELVWGAAWLYRATGDESYKKKVDEIWDYPFGELDPDKFLGASGPISWDDKRPGCYILIAMLTKDQKRIDEAYSYCDAIIAQKTTPGGLWYDDGLSIWGANRYASNAASMVAMFANFLPESDPKRAKYVEFVQKQTDYILGNNPAKVNYVVGSEENSPKAVHHRGASGVFDSQDKAAKPDANIYTLWGALAGGPDENDKYIDSRSNYQMTEVALDYNAAFQMNLAFLTQEGLSKPDPDSVKNHERSYPKKAETPDIRLKFKDGEFSIATGSGMRCSGWCISYTSSSYKVTQVSDCYPYKIDGPETILCNKRENNSLDGEGTERVVKFQSSGSDVPTEFTVQCDGFHAPLNHQKVTYQPEWGRKYKVVNGGGPENTTPLFEETECWPQFTCDGTTPAPSPSKPKTTTTKKTDPTTPVSNDDCFAKALGYKCCNNEEVQYTDDDGQWGYVNGEWCGIGGSSKAPKEDCHGYSCCTGCEVVYRDETGNWGSENDDWCFITSACDVADQPTCTGQDDGYPCCSDCNVQFSDESGDWGVENNAWCGISSLCY